MFGASPLVFRELDPVAIPFSEFFLFVAFQPWTLFTFDTMHEADTSGLEIGYTRSEASIILKNRA